MIFLANVELVKLLLTLNVDTSFNVYYFIYGLLDIKDYLYNSKMLRDICYHRWRCVIRYAVFADSVNARSLSTFNNGMDIFFLGWAINDKCL